MYIHLDISGDSIEAAKLRHNSHKLKGSTNNPPPFTAEFYTMDCTKVKTSFLELFGFFFLGVKLYNICVAFRSV